MWSPTVGPPRLGGNTRMGVFATRSPFRPNPIGLSCVRLEGIRREPELGCVLEVSGADLMDGTPILDIKPYLPYGDCHPDAVGGFASAPAGAVLEVEIPPSLLAQVPEDRREALIGVLAQDPRPHYQKDSDRVYGFGFAGLEVRFTVSEGHLTVREILQARCRRKPVKIQNAPSGNPDGAFLYAICVSYFAAFAALMASISMGVTLNRSPQMP